MTELPHIVRRASTGKIALKNINNYSDDYICEIQKSNSYYKEKYDSN